jgi:hypothetical protein
VKPEYWVVIDQLTGRGEHSVDLLFHTPYDKYELEASTKIFRSQELAIIPVAPDDLKPEIHECAEKPIQGWFSPCYGKKQPATTLVYSCAGELPKTMITVLDPGRSLLDARLMERTGIRDMTINIELRGLSDTLVFGRDQKSSARTGVDTDAEIICIRRNKINGRIVRLSLISGSYIRLDSRLVLEASVPVTSVDVTILPDGKTEIEADPEANVRLQL